MINNITIECLEALKSGLQPAKIITQLVAKIQALVAQNENLTAQIAWFQRQLFGGEVGEVRSDA